jgi:hypothetical protein
MAGSLWRTTLFDDMDVLKVWAAFITVHTSTDPAAGNYLFARFQLWLEDAHFLSRITRLREVLSLMPVIKARVLDADDSESVLYYLRKLVING